MSAGALLELARVGNGLLVVASVVLGGWLAGGAAAFGRSLVGGLALALAAAGANVLNDRLDLAIDRVNRPDRPLPRGSVAPRHAAVLSAVLFALALATAAVLGAVSLVGVAALSALAIGYCYRWKRAGLAGNVAVAAVAGGCLLLGALVGGDAVAGAVPALFAFLVHLGREIVKDVEDREGDRRAGVITLATRWGPSAALRAAAVPLLLLAVLTPAPYLGGLYGARYLAIVVLAADPLLVLVAAELLARPERARPRRLSTMLKLAMVGGLAAIAAGAG